MSSKKKRRNRINKNNHNSKYQKTPEDKVKKAFADIIVSDPRFKILYLVPHFSQASTEASIFGWYTPALHQAAAPLMRISTLPADIREPFTSREFILMFRLSRRIWPIKTPIQLDALSASNDLLKSHPFIVFLSNDAEIAKEIDNFICKSGLFCLHVSTERAQGRLSWEELSVSEIVRYCNAVVDRLETKAEYAEFAKIAREVMAPNDLHKILWHPLPLGHHNITTPNEKALMAFGWALNNVKPIWPPPEKISHVEHYVNRICLSADAVMKERSSLLKKLYPEPIDYRYIIAIQSIYWGHFSQWRDRIANVDGQNRVAVSRAYSSIVQATTYIDTFVTNDNYDLQHDKILLGIKKQQAADAKSFTAGLTALSTASLAPVLRLEPKLNQIRGDLKNLALCVRARGHHFEWKQSRLASRISDKMRLLINKKYLDRIDRKENGRIEGMKLVSDIPLELIHTGGMPLSMRFDISRIPVLPGNAFLAACFAPPVIIPMSSFQEILVIRSFHDDDPIKYFLEKALSTSTDETTDLKVRIKFIDVATENEFIAALDGFHGALMIFDGHGVYDDNIGAGMIVIGGKKIDAWQLKNRCEVPPIVIFSACNTQPLDGSHSSTATAAFALGARSVLGTTLPIEGVKSSIFIRRLIWRIEAFLPLMVKRPTRVTWRELISGMLRMSHVTEIMAALQKNAGPEYKGVDFSPVQLKANFCINEQRPDWYKDFVYELSSLVGLPINKVEQDIKSWASMTDSMKYVQLGNPENIIIVENLPSDILRDAFGSF